MEPVIKRGLSRRKNLLAALLTLSGFLLLFSSAGAWVIDRAIRHPGPAPVPEVVAGLPMSDLLTGPQAVEDLTRLHHMSFPLSSAAVAQYGLNGEATLWASGTPLQPMARPILLDMRDRIAEGRSPFQPVAEREVGERTIYELDGMGQKHFYFQSKNLLIWLAVDPALAEQALSQLMEYYP